LWLIISQKEIIAKVTWKVIQKDGIENAIVKKIAQEVRILSGTLQYYFNLQNYFIYA